MNPSEMKELAALYKEKNDLSANQSKRMNDLDITARIREETSKVKETIEQGIMKATQNGTTASSFYDFYVVDAFMKDNSMEGCLKAAEMYQEKAMEGFYGAGLSENDIEFDIETSAKLYALHALMEEGFDISYTPNHRAIPGDEHVQPIKHPSNYHIIIDWSNAREVNRGSKDFLKEAESLRCIIQDMRKMDSLQERLVLLELENRALRNMANYPEQQNIHQAIQTELGEREPKVHTHDAVDSDQKTAEARGAERIVYRMMLKGKKNEFIHDMTDFPPKRIEEMRKKFREHRADVIKEYGLGDGGNSASASR